VIAEAITKVTMNPAICFVFRMGNLLSLKEHVTTRFRTVVSGTLSDHVPAAARDRLGSLRARLQPWGSCGADVRIPRGSIGPTLPGDTR
jgi:hypothetical protein